MQKGKGRGMVNLFHRSEEYAYEEAKKGLKS